MDEDPRLIFDVGVFNGDDSAYYLHKGYKVVGVEANPLLIRPLEQRFGAHIRAGRYELVPMGIAETAGRSDFWVCDDHPEWSSFDRSIASRRGSRHHAVTISTCRFGSLLEQFGVPHYCKIDIEGKDNLCLRDMAGTASPEFLSIELIRGDRQIELLTKLGYTRFKVISQLTLRQPRKGTQSFKSRLPLWLLKQLLRVESRTLRHRRDGTWRFPRGSSGPFGNHTPGEWVSSDEANALVELIERAAAVDWHDIHACRSAAGGPSD